MRVIVRRVTNALDRPIGTSDSVNDQSVESQLYHVCTLHYVGNLYYISTWYYISTQYYVST